MEPTEVAALIVAAGGVFAAWATHRRGVMELLHKHSEKQAEERQQCQQELKETRKELQQQITQQADRLFEVEKENRQLVTIHLGCTEKITRLEGDNRYLTREVELATIAMNAWKSTPPFGSSPPPPPPPAP